MNKEQILPELKKYLAEKQRSIDEIDFWLADNDIRKIDLVFALLYVDGLNQPTKNDKKYIIVFLNAPHYKGTNVFYANGMVLTYKIGEALTFTTKKDAKYAIKYMPKNYKKMIGHLPPKIQEINEYKMIAEILGNEKTMP